MATSPSTAAVIERLGDRYEILQPIGRPCGYDQLLAKDMQQQRPVVIKSLAMTDNTPAGDICCFEREIHLLEALQHRTIPRYLDSFTLDTSQSRVLILVQAHAGGRTLAEQVGAGKTYREAEIKAIAKQLLQGLIYLHGKGLVHRDIKPSSVVIAGDRGEPSQVSWLNLGTVQYLQAQNNQALVGTYGYMPPEQVGGQATFASDLYGLGATLIYLATGCHLGELTRHGRKIDMACATPQLSAGFRQWLQWLVESHAGDRPASAKQALSALNRLPLSMLKRQLRPKNMQSMPVPIQSSLGAREQLYFTKIKQSNKPRSLELVVPPLGLQSFYYQRALPPLLMGSALLALALYLISLLELSLDMLSTVPGLASLAAACLGLVGCAYSFCFLKRGFSLLGTYLLRQVHIQLESDVLLIAYKYWLRSPVYVVNTKREDIYNISALPDGGALRILTHHNRTHHSPCDCYKLTVGDGALSHRDIRWLNSLLNDWRRHPGSCS